MRTLTHKYLHKFKKIGKNPILSMIKMKIEIIQFISSNWRYNVKKVRDLNDQVLLHKNIFKINLMLFFVIVTNLRYFLMRGQNS